MMFINALGKNARIIWIFVEKMFHAQNMLIHVLKNVDNFYQILNNIFNVSNLALNFIVIYKYLN